MTARLGPLQGGGLWGSVAVILAFLAISIPQYGQPYVIDEAVFPYSSAGILQHGAPFFYDGETRPSDIGLWHPPLYEYLLALEMLVFGTSSFVVRSFGAICVIAAFYVLTLALRRIAPELKQYGYVVLAALVLLNPLVVSDALVPDIDGTLGILLTAFAIWIATIVIQRPVSWRLFLGLFAFATVAISTKYIIAGILALILGCAALLALEQRWRKVLAVVGAFAAATVVSLGLLFALGALLKFDARGPFVYLFGSLGTRTPGKSGLQGTISDLLIGSGSNLVWIGPAIIACGVAAWLIVLVLRPAGVSFRLVGLAVASSLAIMLGYSYITGSPFGFPKYTNIVVPSLALAIVTLLTLLPRLATRSARRASTVSWIVAAYVLILVVGTVATFLIASSYEFGHIRKVSELAALFLADFIGVLVATAALVAVLSGPNSSARIQKFRRPLAVGVIAAIAAAPVMVQTSSSVVNLVSPYATRYYYGERGMGDFLSRADKIIPPGAEVIAAKDIGLQLRRPFYEDAFLLPLPPSKVRTELDRIDAPWLVTRRLHDYSEQAYPAQFAVLREYYAPVLDDPNLDFVLWKHK